MSDLSQLYKFKVGNGDQLVGTRDEAQRALFLHAIGRAQELLDAHLYAQVEFWLRRAIAVNAWSGTGQLLLQNSNGAVEGEAQPVSISFDVVREVTV